MTDQPHKKAYDFGQLRSNLQMETTGDFGQRTDSWLGLPCFELDSLSIKKRKTLVIRRVEELLLNEAHKRKNKIIPLTRPIDTAQNKELIYS